MEPLAPPANRDRLQPIANAHHQEPPASGGIRLANQYRPAWVQGGSGSSDQPLLIFR
jgi:hypothetical protein